MQIGSLIAFLAHNLTGHHGPTTSVTTITPPQETVNLTTSVTVTASISTKPQPTVTSITWVTTDDSTAEPRKRHEITLSMSVPSGTGFSTAVVILFRNGTFSSEGNTPSTETESTEGVVSSKETVSKENTASTGNTDPLKSMTVGVYGSSSYSHTAPNYSHGSVSGATISTKLCTQNYSSTHSVIEKTTVTKTVCPSARAESKIASMSSIVLPAATTSTETKTTSKDTSPLATANPFATYGHPLKVTTQSQPPKAFATGSIKPSVPYGHPPALTDASRILNETSSRPATTAPLQSNPLLGSQSAFPPSSSSTSSTTQQAGLPYGQTPNLKAQS